MKNIPQRTCMGCNEKKEKIALCPSCSGSYYWGVLGI